MSEGTPSNGTKTAGRGPGGKFAKGNPGGPGNPNVADVGRHRARFFAALRDDDVARAVEVIRDVMAGGKDSERLAAARELLDRVLGKAVQSDLLERIEKLEALLGDKP